MSVERLTRGDYQVTRFCCAAATCARCNASGTHGRLDKRARLVQLARLSRDSADRVAANWRKWGAAVELAAAAASEPSK